MKAHSSGNVPLRLAFTLRVLTLFAPSCVSEVEPGPEVEAQPEPLQLHARTTATEAAQCYLRAQFDASAPCFTEDSGLAGQCYVSLFGFSSAWWRFSAFHTDANHLHESITIGSHVQAEVAWCEGSCGLAANVYQYDLFVHGNTAACFVSGNMPDRVGTMYWDLH